MFQRDEPGVSPFLSPFFNPFCTPRQISCRLGIEPRLNAINELPWEGEEAESWHFWLLQFQWVIRRSKIAAWNCRKVTKADLEFERLTNGLTLGVEGQI